MYGEIGMVERRIAALERNLRSSPERRAIRVLLVEDDPTDARLARRLLERSSRFVAEVTHQPDPASAAEAMRGGGYDLWLLDYWIGCVPSSQIVAKAGARAREGVGVVLLTGSLMDDVEDDACEHGAAVCLGKTDVNGGTLDSAIAAALRSTKRARSEAELEELARRRAAAMGDLAHEVGNLLNASRMTLELDALAPDAERTRETMELLGGQIEQLHDATRAMLDEAELASPDAGAAALHEADPVGIDAFADRVDTLCRPLVEGAGRRFGIAAQGSEGTVNGVLLAQIALNFVINAAKYSPPGGAIEVEIGREGDELFVRVLDEGDGLSPERFTELVRRGVRGDEASAPGHGLGLALVSRFAARLGGRLEASRRGAAPAHVGCRVPMTR